MKNIFRLTQLYVCGLLGAAMITLAVPVEPASALSLSNPATVGTAEFASEGLTTEVRGGHRGGGGHFRGGGRRFGGFHRGFRRGGFYRRHFGYRRFYRRRFYGGPRFYGYPRRCRVVFTYYGPRRICRFRPRRFFYY